jgi:hypothetical protein
VLQLRSCYYLVGFKSVGSEVDIGVGEAGFERVNRMRTARTKQRPKQAIF